MVGISGYNGAFDNSGVIPGEKVYPDHVTAMRNAGYGPRPDGKNYTWPKDIVPYRIYVGKDPFDAAPLRLKYGISPMCCGPGVKGKLEDGSDAPADDFLARNGFKYGQIYGFAIDMTNTTVRSGPTGR